MYEGERFNGATHLAGLAMAVAASGALIARAAELKVDTRQIISCAVFAASMIAVYASSVLYHCTRGPNKARWAKADHCAIYLLIAGTYTPLAFGPVDHAWSAAMGVAIWLLAAIGISRELWWARGAAPALPLYLAMGWLGVIFAAPIAGALSSAGLTWLLAGAAAYTVGTLFYVKDKRWRHAHGIWHLFVMGGSACHFVTVFGFLRYGTPA
ncbi:PAQR family membrane homeostasis protein TrhA [Achromobacter spanius]|uniref:Hemolysin D n=1 Tax=Achromobacter spanius TaxID=217203 RepID=A0AAW3HY42_9BURK|nr:hemolysin III family protein [Achromobacter spanius]KNE23584.1 hemolysin D [Achromobacter spanius]MCW3153396.1 hemolysin III family protein [Achromobacter spanius]